MTDDITKKVLDGGDITRSEADELVCAELDSLMKGADDIRKKYKGRRAELCSVINGRAGGCGEDCRFCAQSAHNKADVRSYPFLDENYILADCRAHRDMGIHRYSVVTSGRSLKGEEFERALRAYRLMKSECGGIGLCASFGLITYEQLKRLKESGVTRYHCNLETSERCFGFICTTHSYSDKVNTVKLAKKAGLEVCSGGIIGMGETMADRIDMAFALRELGADSIPINILKPVKNTVFENAVPLSTEEIIRTVAIFRYINKTADIRMAAGREDLRQSGRVLFSAGADSAITGNYLTTEGSAFERDKKMLEEMGFEP